MEVSYEFTTTAQSLRTTWEAATFSRPSDWIEFTLPISTARMTSNATVVTLADCESAYVPRTPLGRKLLALRAKAVSAGVTLLNEEQVREEVRRRHGGVEAGEADVH